MTDNIRGFFKKNILLSTIKLFCKRIRGFRPPRESDFKELPVKIIKKKIVIITPVLNYDERFELRKNIYIALRDKLPQYTVKVKDLNVGYYDKCLWRYVEEIYNGSCERGDACWNKYAQNNKCVDRLEDSENFDIQRKNRFLNKIKKSHLSLDDEIFKRISFDEDNFIYIRSKDRYHKPYKVEFLLKAVRKNGWNALESQCNPMIIGYSKATGIHQVISGRHRLAVLKCLINRGILNKNLKIRCHYIEYHFDTLSYTRPYFEQCKACHWNEEIVLNGNTHQDFSVKAGRIDVLSKETIDKWSLINKAPDNIFRGKTIIDIGAYRGLYCLKVLEKGAVKATVFEPSEQLFADALKLKKHIGEERLYLYQGDFYNFCDRQHLIENKHDTALFLGIIHHLLRIGIQKRLLYTFEELMSKIAEFVNCAVIIEFAMPKEDSLNLPELREHKEAFSRSSFEEALSKRFFKYKILGRCKYRRDRFMYYALK